MIIKLKSEYGRSWVINSSLKDEPRKPIFGYGQDIPVTLEIYHENGAAYTAEELSVFVAFQFAIDNDYSNATDLAVVTTGGFTVSENTISFIAGTNTPRFLAILNSKGSADGIAELKCYKSGELKSSMTVQFDCTLKNVVADDNEDPPEETQSNFYTKVQDDQLLAGKQDKVSFEEISESATLSNLDRKRIIFASGTIEITLHSAVGSETHPQIINVGTGTITITPDGTETINGATGSVTIESQYSALNLLPYNGNWIVTDNAMP